MKKNTSIAALLLAVSALSFGMDKNAASAVADSGNAQKTADSVQTYQYEEVLGWNHRQLIEAFGIPDDIYADNTSSVMTYLDGHMLENVLEYDIVFIYKDKGLQLTLDSYARAALLDHTKLQDNAYERHVCGIAYFSKESENFISMPRGLSFSDTLADIIRKCGNPDDYSKDFVTYTFPANDSISEKAKTPNIRKKEVADIISISMLEKTSSIHAIFFSRLHTFYTSLR